MTVVSDSAVDNGGHSLDISVDALPVIFHMQFPDGLDQLRRG
jgi:hypothetical protein